METLFPRLRHPTMLYWVGVKKFSGVLETNSLHHPSSVVVRFYAPFLRLPVLLYLAASERQQLYSSSLKQILFVVARRSWKTLYFTNRASHNEFKNLEL